MTAELSWNENSRSGLDFLVLVRKIPGVVGVNSTNSTAGFEVESKKRGSEFEIFSRKFNERA